MFHARYILSFTNRVLKEIPSTTRNVLFLLNMFCSSIRAIDILFASFALYQRDL
jgi:hypothetical protein